MDRSFRLLLGNRREFTDRNGSTFMYTRSTVGVGVGAEQKKSSSSVSSVCIHRRLPSRG